MNGNNYYITASFIPCNTNYSIITITTYQTCPSSPKIQLTDMEETKQEKGISWTTFTVEIKMLGLLGGPMVAVTLTQYLLPIISMMMVGHLGELALSSTAITLSLACVTGFNLIVSLSSYP